jgi:hypothetical protein
MLPPEPIRRMAGTRFLGRSPSFEQCVSNLALVYHEDSHLDYQRCYSSRRRLSQGSESGSQSPSSLSVSSAGSGRTCYHGVTGGLDFKGLLNDSVSPLGVSALDEIELKRYVWTLQASSPSLGSQCG